MRIRKHLMHIYCHLCQTDLAGLNKPKNLVEILLTHSVLHFEIEVPCTFLYLSALNQTSARRLTIICLMYANHL